MKLFHPRLILRILSTILLIESVTFLFCIPVARYYEEPVSPFIWSSVITFLGSLAFSLLSQNEEKSKFNNRDGYIVVASAWILFIVFGTLPYLISGAIPGFTDAFFECSSGFTTTGATIIPDLDPLPHSVLFWRSFTHWIGGFGIIVLVIIILPSLKITGYQLFTLESSLKEKIHPKTKSVGFRILFIYLGLTISEILFLVAGDMDMFESVCHTFGTVATGGFSVRNDSLASYSAYSQYVVMIFMFLAGISQVVYYYFFKRNFIKVRNNEELRFYFFLVLVAGVIASSILIVNTPGSFERAIRDGFFHVISVITTTGFATADYLFWPGPSTLLIFLLLFTGASTGSTTGGIKVARHLVVIKSIRSAFTRLVHPSVLSNIRINGKIVSGETSISIISFVMIFLFIFLIGTVLIVITGSDVITAASAVAASLGNVGPGLGTAGPMNNFAHFPGIAKTIFSLLMIIGRIEIIAVLTLFTRSFWRF